MDPEVDAEEALEFVAAATATDGRLSMGFPIQWMTDPSSSLNSSMTLISSFLLAMMRPRKMSFMPVTGILVASDATSKRSFAEAPFSTSIGTRLGGFVSDRDSCCLLISLLG